MTNSKLIFDLIENGDENITKSYITSMICEKAKARLDEEKEKESGSTESAEIKADSEKDEITLDPEFQKEFFLKTFEYKGKIITLKKVGMGASAPVSAYVDGKRKDIFLSLKQARKGIKNIDNFEDKLSKSQESASDMLHYFQERIKRDLL
jgi:hypothetical protein